MPSSKWIAYDLFYSFILVPDDYTHIFNATEYNVTVFQSDFTEASILLYLKIFVKENVLKSHDVLTLASQNPLFLIGSSYNHIALYPVDDVDELQIIEDSIIAGSDLEIGVYKFDLRATFTVNTDVEVVKVIIIVEGKEKCIETNTILLSESTVVLSVYRDGTEKKWPPIHFNCKWWVEISSNIYR